MRSLVLACPDGCGEVLTVNLDKRAGKAWRLYGNGDDLSLYPSVWREGGCHSHFIIRRGRIWWCGPTSSVGSPSGSAPTNLRKETLNLLPLDRYVHFLDLADEMEAIPWEVLDALQDLVEDGLAERGIGDDRLAFRRRASPALSEKPRLTRMQAAMRWLQGVLSR